MPVVKLASEEVIVRALHEPYYQPSLKRGTPSAFVRVDVSVSRLSILTFPKIIEIFEADLNKPHNTPPVLVEAVAVIAVGDVLKICNEREGGNLSVSVVEAIIKDDPPNSDNPAHAQIEAVSKADLSKKRPLTKGMANDILKKSAQWDTLGIVLKQADAE